MPLADQTPKEAALPSALALSDYDYPLPRHLIAKHPLKERDQSRMMVLDRQSQTIHHHHFHDLPDLLQAGDLMIVNNTQVLPARFQGRRQGCTGQVEILLLYPNPSDSRQWLAMMRPARKLQPGTAIELDQTSSTIEILERPDRGRGLVCIHLQDEKSVEALMDKVGHVPIPPYLERPDDPSDRHAYQTVYARVPGAQAAPTAGLHFTEAVINRLKTKGIDLAEITLAVGSGTFRSVDAPNIADHRMDPEHYTLPEETAITIETTRHRGGRIIATGTTVTKTLETVMQKYGQLQPDQDWSTLFIYPGFPFQIVDGLLTNFHLPKTTLFMLVCAFADREFMRHAYMEAIAHGYRFYSYGDCMLIL